MNAVVNCHEEYFRPNFDISMGLELPDGFKQILEKKNIKLNIRETVSFKDRNILAFYKGRLIFLLFAFHAFFSSLRKTPNFSYASKIGSSKDKITT